MAKFNRDLIDDVLSAAPEKKKTRGQPRNENIQHGDPVRERLPYGYRRATFHLREDLLQRLRDIAYTDRERIQDLANRYIEAGIEQAEADHKAAGTEILQMPDREPIPNNRKKRDED